jgi:transposase, IS5 family
MRQRTFSDEGFEKHRKTTRKEKFLIEMNAIIPWQDLALVVKPFYPTPEGAGRRPIGIERMLRIYCLQHWFQLSDPAAEESLYDSRAFRQFVGIDLGREPVPDETTILKFRHLMEKHNLGEQFFHCINNYLEENGLKVERGTIVDATIINAPSSTKNQEKKRDPDMCQTRKGNQWYFGMKAHIGVDSKTKLIHSVVATAANVHDSQILEDLLHGEETRVWGDSAYAGQKDVLAQQAPNAKDFTNKKAARHRPLTEKEEKANTQKSKVRAKVEHVFHVLKCQFGFRKVRYRGLEKNANHLFSACALVNIVLAARQQILPHRVSMP